MGSIKEISLEAIKKLPEDCDASDIMYELHVISQVMEGLRDAENGRTITTDELLQRVEQWGK